MTKVSMEDVNTKTTFFNKILSTRSNSGHVIDLYVVTTALGKVEYRFNINDRVGEDEFAGPNLKAALQAVNTLVENLK